MEAQRTEMLAGHPEFAGCGEGDEAAAAVRASLGKQERALCGSKVRQERFELQFVQDSCGGVLPALERLTAGPLRWHGKGVGGARLPGRGPEASYG